MDRDRGKLIDQCERIKSQLDNICSEYVESYELCDLSDLDMLSSETVDTQEIVEEWLNDVSQFVMDRTH